MSAIYHHGQYVGKMPKIENCDFISNDGTGRLGHYSTQGDRKIYQYHHKNGAITEIVIGTGYWPSSPGSGYDWGTRTVAKPANNCQCNACVLDRQIRAEMSREIYNKNYED